MNEHLLINFANSLITFANSLDPDQAKQNIGPDLDPNCFDTLVVFLKELLEKVGFEKNKQVTRQLTKS